jgi:hypothetical protein
LVIDNSGSLESDNAHANVDREANERTPNPHQQTR